MAFVTIGAVSRFNLRYAKGISAKSVEMFRCDVEGNITLDLADDLQRAVRGNVSQWGMMLFYLEPKADGEF
jgi:hypothetical protein